MLAILGYNSIQNSNFNKRLKEVDFSQPQVPTMAWWNPSGNGLCQALSR